MHQSEQSSGHATINGRSLKPTKYTKSSHKSSFERLICNFIILYYVTWHVTKLIHKIYRFKPSENIDFQNNISSFMKSNYQSNILGQLLFWSKRGNDKKSSNHNKRDIILFTIMYNIILCFACVLSLLYNKTLKYTERKAIVR